MDTTSTKEVDSDAGKVGALKPAGMWGTVLAMTPVVLTVLATTFAGLSSSEMTRSMYYRSLAAQQQSKAGDQWGFFQAKKIRGNSLEMTAELLQTIAHPGTFDPKRTSAVAGELIAVLEKPATSAASAPEAMSAAATLASVKKARAKLERLLEDEKTRQCLSFLTGPALPQAPILTLANTALQEHITAVVEAIGRHDTEEETADKVRKVKPEDIGEATRLAEQNVDAFGKVCEPTNDVIGQLRSIMSEIGSAMRQMPKPPPGGTPTASPLAALATELDGLNNSFKSAVLDFDARRYRQESLLNRKTAEFYEVKVRRSGLESERHRQRSSKFFYSMLVAQGGVTIASLALARSQRSVLWLLATAAGLAAVTFSAYVYMAG